MKRIIAALTGNSESLGRRMMKGTAWLALGQASVQIGTIVRLAILANFLDPSDFGIMGIVFLMLRMLDAFTMPGLNQALIQRQGEIETYLPSVFTVNVVRALSLAGIIWATSPRIATFFGEPTAELVIQASALVVLLRGLESPAIATLHRELQFRRLFYRSIFSTGASLLCAITLTFFFQNVWVLMMSLIFESLVSVIGSYIIAPWQPGISFKLAPIKELNRFGRWVVLSNIVVFFSLQLDSIVVGRLLGTSALGLYGMAVRISQLPATHISYLISTVAFPALSSIANSPDQFRRVYLRMFAVISLANSVIALFLLSFARPFVHLVLGDGWEAAVPALQILAISGLVRSLTMVGGNVFYAAGFPKYNVMMNALRLLVFLVIIVPLVRLNGINGAALAVLISTLCTVPTYLILIQRSIGVRPMDHFSFLIKTFPRFRGVFRGGAV